MPFLQRILEFLGVKSDVHHLVVKNTIFLVSSEVAIKAVTAVLAIFIARYLGVNGYGELQFSIAFAALFQFVLDFGFNGLLVREVAGSPERARKYLENMISMKIILVAACYSILSLLVLVANKPLTIKYLILLAGVQLVFITSIDFFSALFQAFDKIYLRAVLRLSYSLLLAALCSVVLWLKGGVVQLMYAYVVSSGVVFLTAFFIAQSRFTRFSLSFNFPFWRRIIGEITPFALIAVITTVYSRVDIIMLSFLKGEAAVGVYAAANNMYSAAQLLPVLAISAGYAPLSRLFKQGRDKFNQLCQHYFWFLLVIGVAGGIFTILFANPIVHFVFGEKFAQSGPVLRLMGFSLMTCTLVYFMSYFFSVTRMQKYVMGVLLMAFVLNVGLNYALIVKLGVVGAVIATSIAQFYQVVMLLLISYYKGYRVWKS